MRKVEYDLIVRVRVDRRHEARLDLPSSWRIFAIGATQFVVHDALETMSCAAGSYASSLTPRTTVMSGSVAGAEMTTFFAPASRCFCAPWRSVKKPVDSRTTSTPRSGATGARPGRAPTAFRISSPAARRTPSARLDLPRERPEVGVVAEQVRHRPRVPEVVQRDDGDVRAEGVLRSEEVPPDPAETVDTDANAHPLLRDCDVPCEASRR